MGPRFSIVYPTRHRPDFVRQALRILEAQGHDDFQVVVSDNYLDPAFSCEAICRETSVAKVTYVRPPRPVGMVENWNHALEFATGDYVLFLTDKMFVLPDALGRIERALQLAGEPEIISWISDSYNPAAFPDYFGAGIYRRAQSDVRSGTFQAFLPAAELDRRGRAAVSRPEQSSSDYCRGKLVFGAYRRDLVQRIVQRSGALFHSINPDYTSMILALAAARGGIEVSESCVVSVNTDISNGMLSDTDDTAALRYLSSLEGGAEAILPSLIVPGLYVSQHNWVAHDFLALKQAFDLPFEFDLANWLVYCTEDVDRPGRRWSDPSVEAEQKGLLRTFVESLDPSIAAAVGDLASERAARAPVRRSLARRLLGRMLLGGLSERVFDRRWKSSWWSAASLSAAVAVRVG